MKQLCQDEQRAMRARSHRSLRAVVIPSLGGWAGGARDLSNWYRVARSPLHEDLSERELRVPHTHFQRLAEMAAGDGDVGVSHSVEEAESRHALKRERRARNRPESRIAP